MPDNTSNAILDQGDVKIDYESELSVGKFEIGQQMGQVDWMAVFHRLELANHQIFDQDINPEGLHKRQTILSDWHADLPLEPAA